MKKRLITSILTALLLLTLSIPLALPVAVMGATVVFTGNVTADFTGAGILTIPDIVGDVGLPASAPAGTVSGWEMSDLRLTYDAATDTMFVGMNAVGIIGDADGDGSPGGTAAWLAALSGADTANLSASESVAVYFDLDQDGVFDVIGGVSGVTDITGFSVNLATIPFTIPPFSFGAALPGHTGVNSGNPSAASPDFEFTILSWSTLPGQDALLAGFTVGAFAGSLADDGVGEDFILYSQTPSTVTEISALPTTVVTGGSVNLTVTEENDGGVDLTSPQVVVTDNFSNTIATLVAPPNGGGDTDNDGVLDVGEKWTWTLTTGPLTADTTFIATGSGVAPGDIIVTYPGDPQEQDTADVDVIHPTTITTIDASPALVESGGSANLTVTEENDGDVDLTSPQVVVNDGTSDIATLTAPPNGGGDTDNDGVLDVGEKWTWVISTGPLTATTTFTATGSGVDPLGNIITFPGDQDEQDAARVQVANPTTITTIDASPTTVVTGDSANLTVTETNDGDVDLTSPQVVVNDGTSDIATLTAATASGDDGDGVLEPTETWTWVISTGPLTATTTFTATGSGVDPLGNVITFPDDQDEQDATRVIVINPTTITTIDASPTTVVTGDSANLTVTETNDGDVDLTSPQVVVNDGTSDIATLTAATASGDDGDGVLEPTETWTWVISTGPLTATTTFTATGSGVDPLGNVVTFPDDQDEQDAARVIVIHPSTITTITAVPDRVADGASSNLTITETNDGDVPLTNPFVDVTKNGNPLFTLANPPDSGDTNGDGVLDPLETWTWTRDSGPISTISPTVFVATGHGTDPLGNDITYPDDPEEQDDASVTITGEGLTPGFWKANASKKGGSQWTFTGFSPSQNVTSVFSSTNSSSIYASLGSKTLLQGLSFQGGSTIKGAAEILLRAAIAAVLNDAHPEVDYPLMVAEIQTLVNAALDSQDRDTILALAALLDGFNNAGADLSQNP